MAATPKKKATGTPKQKITETAAAPDSTVVEMNPGAERADKAAAPPMLRMKDLLAQVVAANGGQWRQTQRGAPDR